MKTILLLAIPLLATFLSAAEPELVFKDAKKQQVRHSMIGQRDTLLFYTFPKQAAVLVLNIANSNAALLVGGTVHLFAPGTPAEALAKWVNNQHSDGLFPDIPKPILSFKLPEGTCTITERELVGQEKSPIREDVFADYKVKLTVKEHRVEGKYRLPGFADEANVFMKSEPS